MTIVIQKADIELSNLIILGEDEKGANLNEEHRKSTTLSPIRITRLLLLIAGALLAAHVIVVELGSSVLATLDKSIDYAMYQSAYYLLYNEFSLGKELNIPTYFSTFVLVLAAYLLRVVHRKVSPKTSHWAFLSYIFIFLAADELFMIHEVAGGFLGNRAIDLLENVPPFLQWAWMIPYSVLAAGIGFYFLKFTLQLPLKTKVLFLFSGALYVFAALGLEFFESHFDTVYGPENMINQVLYPLEEVLEMVAVILFIHALLDYLVQQRKVLVFRLEIKG